MHHRVETIHVDDPKQVIWESCVNRHTHKNELDNIELWGFYLLVGLYIRPATRTHFGLEVPEDVVDDDRYQGKVGLVLKLGPRAFIDDLRDYPTRQFSGMRADADDWVVFRASDGLKVMVGDRECRLIPDSNIRARINHPDAVF